MFVLGIDAGGTKTVCQLANDRGELLNEARGPGAALHVMPDEEVARTLADVIRRASQAAPGSPAAACLGMAGVDRPGEADRVKAILGGILSDSRLLVASDALIALEAGLPGAPGVVLVAGTGAMAYGRDAAGRAARAGGWGHVLADEGSGYWMGRQALRAVVRAADGRGVATALTPLVLEHWRAARPQDLVQAIYTSNSKPTTIAALAEVVQSAAEQGDAVAVSIVDHGARELAAAAVSVTRRLGLSRGPVILAGSLFRVAPSVTARVLDRLRTELPEVVVRRLVDQPAQGAVHLALALAGDRLLLPRYDDDPRL